MKLKNIGSNMTEVETDKGTILFSYSTPVAACLNGNGNHQPGFIRTSKKWSVTTSRHINKWLEGANAREVDQAVLDSLA